MNMKFAINAILVLQLYQPIYQPGGVELPM